MRDAPTLTGRCFFFSASPQAYPRREVVVQDNSMRSVTEPGNLAEFLATAELANEEFDSQKANTVVIESNAFVQVRAQPSAEQIAARKEHWSMLQVPRRPKVKTSFGRCCPLAHSHANSGRVTWTPMCCTKWSGRAFSSGAAGWQPSKVRTGECGGRNAHTAPTQRVNFC